MLRKVAIGCASLAAVVVVAVVALVTTDTTTSQSGGPVLTAFVSEFAGANGPYGFRPTNLDFTVDGDLTAEHLKWSDWGQPITVGKGLFIYRVSSAGRASDAISGSVTLSQEQRCHDRIYYTAAVVNAPGGPFKPQAPISFGSGCSGS